MQGDSVDDETEYRKRLWAQLTEAYGKLVYTRQTQNQAANDTNSFSERLSLAQIVLTAVSSTGFLSAVICDQDAVAVAAAICSAISLGINLYTRGARLPEESAGHVRAANVLWLLDQEFVSLLIDFDHLEITEITQQRDALLLKLDEAYRNAPRTNARHYAKARKQLKEEEAQSFEEGEVDELLPVELRGKYQ